MVNFATIFQYQEFQEEGGFTSCTGTENAATDLRYNEPFEERSSTSRRDGVFSNRPSIIMSPKNQEVQEDDGFGIRPSLL